MGKKVVLKDNGKKREMRMKFTPGNLSQAGECLVEHWPGKPHIVVVTELADNPGMSITNAIEHVCLTAMKELELWGEPVIWIEHYPEGEAGGETGDETFDLVMFPTLIGIPSWRPLRKAAVDLLIGKGGYG